MKTQLSVVAVLFLAVSVAAAQTQPAPAAQTPPQSADPDVERLIPQLQRAHQALNDFANLARYRDANASTPPAAAGENRVVFMGDSITDGWGKGKAPFFPGKPYINRGISGQT
ncbi:MAG TPA: hypothetical protein VG498_10875, partial [Terriglobales bacterium]|nr:hypothetical protein [Terriglobales bacterium]